MLLYRQKQREQPLKEENKMKEYKVRYMWNGKIYAEPRMANSLNEAVLSFVSDLYKDTNSYERIKAGFELACK